MITERERENLKIDLREINERLTNPHTTIMAKEYQELAEKKHLIINKVFNRE